MKLLLSLLLTTSAVANDYHFDCTLPQQTSVIVSGYLQSDGPNQNTNLGKLLIEDKKEEVHIFENQTFNYAWGYLIVATYEGGQLHIQNFYDSNVNSKTGNLIGELREQVITCRVTKDTFSALGSSYIGPWSDTGQDLEPSAIEIANQKASERCIPRLAERVSEFEFVPYIHRNHLFRGVTATANFKCL
jgi:hypothetical protein